LNNRFLIGRRLRFTCLFLGTLLALSLTAHNAQAIPLTDYQKNLQAVINALDTLMQTDESETLTTYETRFHNTLSTVRLVMPKTQMVQTETASLSVENKWFHDELDSLEKAPVAKRREKLFHLMQQLRALEQRVAELQIPASETIDKAAAKEKLNGILSRPEFAPKSKAGNAFWRLINEIARWLEKFLPKQTPLAPGRALSLVKIVQYLVIGLVIVMLAYVARVFLPVLARKRKVKDKSKPEARVVLGEHVAADESAKDLLADAESLARSGQLRAAIRKAYIALLVELGDRKLISLAQHKTNSDYLRSVRETPDLYASMNGLTEIFERNWYGLAQPTPADWQAFRDGYQQTLRTHS
jgi:hypothetical protein